MSFHPSITQCPLVLQNKLHMKGITSFYICQYLETNEHLKLTGAQLIHTPTAQKKRPLLNK